MKNKEEIFALFREKYSYLKSIYPQVGPFDEGKIYQNPDGGWQLNLENWAAITLRSGDEESHEVHGEICKRWYSDGGAFNETGEPGWLGYPVSDQISLKQDGVSNKVRNLAGWMEWVQRIVCPVPSSKEARFFLSTPVNPLPILPKSKPM